MLVKAQGLSFPLQMEGVSGQAWFLDVSHAKLGLFC